MVYDITGFHGGRQNLSFSLRPGQFRTGGRYNVFPGPRVVNNYYGNQDWCTCSNNDSTPKWMGWMMGIGMGTQLLGGILDMFGIGAKSAEGAGGTEQKDLTALKSDIANLKKFYDNKMEVMSNGSILAEIGGAKKTFKTLDDLQVALQKAEEGTKTEETDDKTPSKQEAAINEVTAQKLLNGTNIFGGYANGKFYIIGDDNKPQYFEDLDKFKAAVDELKNPTKSTVANVQAAATPLATNTNKGTTITIGHGTGISQAIMKELGQKYTLKNGKSWKNVMDIIVDANRDNKLTCRIPEDTETKVYTGTENAFDKTKKGTYKGFVVKPNEEIDIPDEIWSQITSLFEEK